MIATIENFLLALTDPQVDQILKMIAEFLITTREGIKTIWDSLSPLLIGYLVYRQAMNRRALDENTEVSKKAFTEANNHNVKIATLTEIVANKDVPQKVEVVNQPTKPVPTDQV